MTAEELKKLMNSPYFYDRYKKSDKWDFLGVLAGRAMQSAEFNEIQHILEEKIKSLGNTFYAEGTIIEGCAISFDTQAKKVNLDAGRVFLDGLVYEVEAAELSVPDTVNVQVGIWKKSICLTEYEKPEYRDPAQGTPQWTMEGGYRIVTTAEWGLSTDNFSDTPFFPVYGISGEAVTQLKEKVSPEYLDTIARYDNHAHGHYVVEGLKVTPLTSNISGKQAFSISEGEAHIEGYEAKISHSVRLIVDELANLADIKSEVHAFSAVTGGTATIEAYHTPIEAVQRVLITKQRTVMLTHGSYSGCSDELPDTSVFKIVDVHQGSLVFIENTDFAYASDRLSWSLHGEEPAPSSTYSVTYYYRASIIPDSFTTTEITISGGVQDSLVEMDYTYRMPRKDLIVMYRDRSINIVRGVAHRYDPVVPSTPPEAICLAEVNQTWNGLPEVTNVAIQRVPVDTLNSMRSQIRDLYSLIARNEQRFNIMIDAPSSAYGVFVDPLLDDDMRDKGLKQNAVIVAQTLSLPIEDDENSYRTINLDTEQTLSFSHEVVINQPMKTKSMKINPYQNFEPIPAQVNLSPAIDRWGKTVTQTVITSTIKTTRGSTHTELTDTETLTEEVDDILRSIDVTVTASGFGPNEPIAVIFDGIEVICSSNKADSKGKFSGIFKIPDGVPTGTKLVRLQGTHTIGDAYFVGIHEDKTVINYYIKYQRIDPLAQTFTLNESRLISGIDFWLAKKGTSDIRVEISGVSLGFPNSETLVSQIVSVGSLTAGQWNRVEFLCPVFLNAGIEYAIKILSDTSDHEVGIAELGDWDSETGWVRSQAYSAGVLLSSSNASTWSAHQNADLSFKLLGAKFSAMKKTLSLGTFNLDGVTDLMPLAEVETTGADTYVTFVLKQNNTEITRMQAWQPIALDNALSGNYTLEAELSGTEKYSPVLGRYPQLFVGKIVETGNYVSREFSWDNRYSNKQIMISTDEYVPTGASVDVYVTSGRKDYAPVDGVIPDGAWEKGDVSETIQLGDGWVRNRRFVGCYISSTRIKIELRGTAAARPLVRNISAVIIDA